MASINDFVRDLTPRERAELDAALRTGEQVRWAARPLVKRGAEEISNYLAIESFALPWLALFSHAAYGVLTSSNRQYDVSVVRVLGMLLAVLFIGGALAVGVFLVLTPWRRRARRRRTLYVVTNHRTLVLQPGYFSDWMVNACPLRENMVRSRVCRPGGSGDLIFTVEASQTGSGEEFKYGFEYLPDLQEAHAALNDAVNDLQDAAELHLGNRPPSC